jgi:predicted DNA-binding transcriptional regulator AlpA
MLVEWRPAPACASDRSRVSTRAVPDRLLDRPEVVETLGLSPRTVERLAQRGYLTQVKVLGATRYRLSEVEAIIRHGTRRLSDVERLLSDPAEAAR